jgi:hypothetical protein
LKRILIKVATTICNANYLFDYMLKPFNSNGFDAADFFQDFPDVGRCRMAEERLAL